MKLLTKQALSWSQKQSRLTFDQCVVATVVPHVRVRPAVKCHCQLLFCGCHGLCEIHFFCLSTFCQRWKDPNSNRVCQLLTGSIWRLLGLFTHRSSSVLGKPKTIFYNSIHFFKTNLQLLCCYCLDDLKRRLSLCDLRQPYTPYRRTLLLHFIL